MQTESFTFYGCWEWTQQEHCWITVESNDDRHDEGIEEIKV